MEKIKVLQPKIAIRHEIAGYGDVVAYVEHEYELRDARQPSSLELTLSFAATVASSECPAVTVEGAARVRACRQRLFQRHRLGGPLAERKDNSGEMAGAVFKAKGKIPLAANSWPTRPASNLRITFTKLDDFGSVTKNVPPERVDDALFDEIGRYLMRDPNSLLREALP